MSPPTRSTPGILQYLGRPSLGTGGFVETPNQRLSVRHVAADRVAGRPRDRADQRGQTASRVPLDDVADRRRGSPAAHRRRRHQRRPRADAHRREAPVGQHPRRHAGRRGRDRASCSRGCTGIEIDTTIFRPATFIELVDRQPHEALLIGALLVVIVIIVVPVRLARGAHQRDRDSALAGRGRARALLPRHDGQHDGPRRLGHRRSVSSSTTRSSTSRTSSDGCVSIGGRGIGRSTPGHPRRLARGARADRLRDADHVVAMVADLLPAGPDRRVLPAAGDLVRAGGRWPRSLVALTMTPALRLILLSRSPLERRESPVVRWLQRGYGGTARGDHRQGHAWHMSQSA